MPPEVCKLLQDVSAAAELVAQFIGDRSFDGYLSDPLVRSGVERQFLIIGEALNRLARTDPSTFALIDNGPRIISFRNVLAHGYDLIVHQVVWDIYNDSLPLLRSQVASLLGVAN